MSIVTFGDAALRFSTREGERFETARDVGLRVDGMTSTAAAVASRLGGEAVWLSKLQDTPLGRRVVAELNEHGLETDVIWTDPDEGRQGLVFYEDAVDPRESWQRYDRADTAIGTLTPGEIALGRVQNADVLFTTGSMAAVSDQAAETIGALLRSTSGLCALDLDFHADLWDAETARDTLQDIFDPVDILFARQDQVTDVFDRTGRPRELVHTIAGEYGFSQVILTRSEHGVVGYHDGVLHELDAFEAAAVDSAGQHGTLIGAFLQQLVDGAPTDEALRYGNAAAAVSRTMSGPVTPLDPADVEALLEAADSGGR